jgi:hypothetical protein
MYFIICIHTHFVLTFIVTLFHISVYPMPPFSSARPLTIKEQNILYEWYKLMQTRKVPEIRRLRATAYAPALPSIGQVSPDIAVGPNTSK